jgi:hypothetical protein
MNKPQVVSALARRIETCWDRLDDAVDELAALYHVDELEIVDRVHRVVASGDVSPTWDEDGAPRPAHD